ncbi:UPF0688 protein C1orf174 homolog [Erythrolamprus reginae]|uniref:UPF0688 protein C1orf174 homolog n=1 Tax=Erythrolamprus reginae TaxID=121349 RepID=UPI00396CB6B4
MRARRGPSRNGTTKSPSKKPRCERKRGAKQKAGAQLGLAAEALELRLQGEEGPSKDPQDVAEENAGPGASEATQPHLSRKAEGEEEEEEPEEGGKACTAGASNALQREPGQASGQASEPDNSIFLNEDSNQPLPMDRFFGSVAFTQDLPPASFSRTNTSRREFRRMHFIAKEEEEESGDEAV